MLLIVRILMVLAASTLVAGCAREETEENITLELRVVPERAFWVAVEDVELRSELRTLLRNAVAESARIGDATRELPWDDGVRVTDAIDRALGVKYPGETPSSRTIYYDGRFIEVGLMTAIR